MQRNAFIIRALVVLVSLFASLSTPEVFAKNADSCECEKLECDTCHRETGVTFYTQKCDGGKQVKSCARPTCALLEPLPARCEAAKNDSKKDRKPTSVVKSKAKPAPTPEVKSERGVEVGTAQVVKGRVWLNPPKSERISLKGGERIHQQDTIQTGADGQIRVAFHDGNIVSLTAKSEIRISQYNQKDEPQKKVLLDLLDGRVRSKVNEKYDGKTSSFEVRTRSAVAGVRGTEFVVTFDKIADNREVTKVETFHGKVKLESGDREQSIEIAKGEQASFVVASASASDVFSKEDISEFVKRGYMTPVHTLSAKELKKLDWETQVKAPEGSRQVAAQKQDPICEAPAGHLNQCAWTCVNNPKGEKRCRTDLPKVNCVRKRCNANGEWADESRLPASFHDMCQPQGNTVKACDY